MRGFSEIFSRANVQQIRTFLLYGVEECSFNGKNSERSIRETEKEIYKLIKSKISEISEYDEIISYIDKLEFELENVYMELGLKCGAIIAIQILKDSINYE